MNDSLHKLDWALHGVGLAVVVSSACLAWWFVYRPLQDARGEALARCSEIAEALQGAERLRAEQAALRRSLAAAHQEEADLLARVPDEAQEAEFLGQIGRLAKNVGLELRDYRPGEVRTQATYSAMEIALACQGNYEALCRFLDGLGGLPRLANLSRLDIDGSQGPEVHTAIIKLVIYFGAAKKAMSAGGRGPHG